MASVPPSGISLAGKVFFGSLSAGTFGLGVWQTQRYFEKQTLITQRTADLEAPPTTLQQLLSQHQNEQSNGKDGSSSSFSFRRVQLQGQYLHSAELLVGPRGPPPGALPDRPGSSAAGMSSAPQGYFVLTPFVPASAKVRQEFPLVIVNRGWVPRHLVVADNRRGQQASRTALLQWDRPVPAKNETHLDVVVVPGKGEAPKFLVADHKMQTRPPQLFWFDLETMQKWVGYNKSSWSSSSQLPPSPPPPPLRLYTAVAATQSADTSWPAAPPVQAVGTFKVEPPVHAAYAFTWYSLSAAGLYMTRKMLTRGR